MSGAQTAWNTKEWYEHDELVVNRQPQTTRTVSPEKAALWSAAAAEVEKRKKIEALIARLKSPHADKIYVGKEFTKADLIRELELLLK